MNIRIFLPLILLPLLLLPAVLTARESPKAAAVTEIQCIKCHSKGMKRIAAPVSLYRKDIHFSVKLGCNDCHGGDPSNQRWHGPKNPAKGFYGKPTPLEIPALCNHCHGNTEYMRSFNPSLPVDQLEKYRTSRHGQLLLNKKDPKVATCVSCHSVHDIRSPSEPASTVYPTNLPNTCARCHSDTELMAAYGISTSQYDDFKASVHGAALLERGDVGAPACNDCHGNHGAFPPEVNSISHVCGLCHVANANLYNSSFHAEIFEGLEQPGCETCHGNHKIIHPDESFLGDGDNATCLQCHEADEDDAGFLISREMKNTLDSLAGSFALATELLDVAGQRGMEVSELKYSLRDIRQNLFKSRTAVHSFDDSEVNEAAGPGLALAAEIIGKANLTLLEHKNRRWWLGGAAILILALILGIYLKLREIEER
jgi:Cytochrome c3/Doubled CXXCH motif (Paired_CXXCH_1)